MQTDDRSGDDLGRNEPDFPPLLEDLEYLLEPGIRYGAKYQFGEDIEWFLENAPESDFETLATLAEKVRLAGDYGRYLEWAFELGDAVECIVDERYPYTVEISEEEREELLPMICVAGDSPDIAKRRIERCLRRSVESRDDSEIARRRKELRDRLNVVASDRTHDMDIHFLFGLMDACDMKFD